MTKKKTASKPTKTPKKKAEQFTVYCLNCKSHNYHQVVKLHTTKINEYDEGEFIYGQIDIYQIVECKGCKSISFRHLSENSDDIMSEGDEYRKTEFVYPSRGDHYLSIKPYRKVPDTVEQLYVQTVKAFNDKLNFLCAAGLRAIIEAICVAQKIKGGTVTVLKNYEAVRDKAGKIMTKFSTQLDGKINGLKEMNLLTRSQCEALHEHRYLGNDALHKGEEPSKDALRIAIQIIEHVLDTLYDIEIQGNKLYSERMWQKKVSEISDSLPEPNADIA